MNRYKVNYYRFVYGSKEVALYEGFVVARRWQIDKVDDVLAFYDEDHDIIAVYKWSLVVSFNVMEKDSG